MISQMLIKLIKVTELCSLNHNNWWLYTIRCSHSMEYSSKLEKGLNDQIKAEHEASVSYLKLAINFLHPCVSRHGFGSYFMKLHKEELVHMHSIIKYQLMRGFYPSIGDIKSIKIQNTTVCQAFELALRLENDVTKSLKDLVILAELEGDYHCADFITATFLLEQIQSTNELWHHLTKLRRMNENELALFHYDTELSKKYSYD